MGGVLGIDQYISKTAILTDVDVVDAHRFKEMKFSVSPIVRVAVDCKLTSDLPKLMEGLKRLSRSDSLVVCCLEETGEHIISGSGELHLEICLKDLQDHFMSGSKIIILPPVVKFCETIINESDRTVMTKTPNKHNRIYVSANPINAIIVEKILKNRVLLIFSKFNFIFGFSF